FLGRVCLHVIRVDASRGRITNFFDTSLQCFPENKSVEEKIGSGARLMQINVATSAMIRGEMKYNLDVISPRIMADVATLICIRRAPLPIFSSTDLFSGKH